MIVKLSRRELGVLALVPRASAQDVPSEPDYRREALDARRRQTEALARRDVPMSTEPAFVFKP
jgi:hypothetical protein